MNGSLTVAFVQALLAGAMYVALGVPAAMVWASATFIVALVPVFGTVMVWGPVAVYLLISGSWIKAVILVGWGMLAVGTPGQRSSVAASRSGIPVAHGKPRRLRFPSSP